MPQVVSGGQTGADQAGWRAAKGLGITTFGWMPKGFLTEDGPRPEFADLYRAWETKSASYPERTRLNAAFADATLLFVRDERSPGTMATIKACEANGRPWLKIRPGTLNDGRVRMGFDWIRERHILRLNIAGHRESKMRGIGEWTETYLVALFRLLLDNPPATSPAPTPSPGGIR